LRSPGGRKSKKSATAESYNQRAAKAIVFFRHIPRKRFWNVPLNRRPTRIREGARRFPKAEADQTKNLSQRRKRRSWWPISKSRFAVHCQE